MPKYYLTRREYVDVIYDYEMYVDKALADSYTKYCKENIEGLPEDFQLTEQDIVMIWDYDWPSDSIFDQEFRHARYNYSKSLGDFIRDWLNEEMWDADCETYDSTTCDTSDGIYIVED